MFPVFPECLVDDRHQTCKTKMKNEPGKAYKHISIAMVGSISKWNLSQFHKTKVNASSNCKDVDCTANKRSDSLLACSMTHLTRKIQFFLLLE